MVSEGMCSTEPSILDSECNGEPTMMKQIILIMAVMAFNNPLLTSIMEYRTGKIIIFGIYLCIYFLLYSSPILILSPIVHFLMYWPKIFKFFNVELHPLISGHIGPLGQGCYKVLIIIVTTLICPESVKSIFNIPPMWVSLSAGVVCVGTPVVLYLWSLGTKSSGKHRGVMKMMKPQDDENNEKSTKGKKSEMEENADRSLSVKAKLKLTVLAFLNALGEEFGTRGLFLFELQRDAGLDPNWANFIQAFSFGAQHWEGIPSGWTGVGLTTIYGFIMGLLTQYGGLSAAVLVHGVADYYIFVYVARMEFSSDDKKKN